MTIIISKDGQKALKIPESDLPAEDYMQSFIHKNPDCIPLYEIKEDIHFFIAAREFSTESGPIDALGFGKDGDIYLIETKLFRNTDKRYVVSQVLDYGASLYKNYRSFNAFINSLDNYSMKYFNESFINKVKEEFSISDLELETLFKNIERNLNDGIFKFIILMDKIHEHLKDLILYLNQNSKFTIIAVELDYYKFDNYEIISPRLFGVEIKKSSMVGTIPSDEDFINSYKDSEDLEKLKFFINFFNDAKENRIELEDIDCYKTAKYFYFRIIFLNSSSFSACLHIDPKYEGGGIQFWTNRTIEKEIKQIIKQKLDGVEILPELKKDYGKIIKWPLKYFSETEFRNVLRKIAKLQ